MTFDFATALREIISAIVIALLTIFLFCEISGNQELILSNVSIILLLSTNENGEQLYYKNIVDKEKYMVTTETDDGISVQYIPINETTIIEEQDGNYRLETYTKDSFFKNEIKYKLFVPKVMPIE